MCIVTVVNSTRAICVCYVYAALFVYVVCLANLAELCARGLVQDEADRAARVVAEDEQDLANNVHTNSMIIPS